MSQVMEFKMPGLKRIAQADPRQRRMPSQQLADRPGKPRRLPADGGDAADLLRMDVENRHPPVEQSDVDGAHGERAGRLDFRFDAGRQIFLRHRHTCHSEAGQHDDDDDGSRPDGRASPHGSASGCLVGCAASNAGCFMQLS